MENERVEGRGMTQVKKWHKSRAETIHNNTLVNLQMLPELEDYQWAYLAGIFEGEGSVYINKRGYPQLSIAMTDEDVVSKIWRWLGKRRRKQAFSVFNLGRVYFTPSLT